MNIENAKYASWLNDSNFDNCKLNRKEYGQFLVDYITGERDGFVLNIDGSWGSGKTEFLKRFYSELLTRKHPVVYIDAWESDFSKDPLTVVTSELLSQVEKFNDGIGSTENAIAVKKLFGKVLKGTAVGLAGLTTKVLVGDGGIGAGVMQTLLQTEPEDYASKLASEYSDQIKAIQEVRTALSLLAEVIELNYDAKLPIVVLVDELDRCRPTYAIEMLEVIKHFFNTSNFLFVVATDTAQLCHSIKAVYGDGFDSAQYLKRFFDRKASLPIPDLKHYLNALNVDFSTFKTSLTLFPTIVAYKDVDINRYIELVSIAYKLEIRDLDQLVNKFLSCLRTAVRASEVDGKPQLINVFSLLIALVELDQGRDEFYNRKDNEPSFYDLADDLKVFETCDFNKLLKISMQSVVLHDTKNPNPNYDGGVIPLRFSHSKIKNYRTNNSCSNFSYWLDDINNKLSSDPRKEKLWMWSDYRQVVELAGYIS